VSVLVGLAGSVAAGKSTLAAQLAQQERAAGKSVAVVSTDGFLLPNATLEARGLLARKGFPESYDAAAFTSFLDALRAGVSAHVPVYSHQIYDILPGAPQELIPPALVIIEGINALQPQFTDGKLDFRLYLHADESDLFRWYSERLIRLRDAARIDPSSYFTRFLALSETEWNARIRTIWESVNLPNLHEHILPTRALADQVLVKAADHSLSLEPESGGQVAKSRARATPFSDTSTHWFPKTERS
jgi:type I pantothenate kinase